MTKSQVEIITRIGIGSTPRLAPTQPLYVVYLFNANPSEPLSVLYEGNSIRAARNTYQGYKSNSNTDDRGYKRLVLECKGRGVYRDYIIEACDL